MGAVSAPESVDQEVVTESPQTEAAPEVVEAPPDGAAAPETETPAATEDAPQLEVPTVEERRYTQAELDAIAARSAQEALERDKRRRQSESGRREAQQRQANLERQRLKDATEVALIKGYGNADQEVVNDLIQRMTSERSDLDHGRVASEMDLALEYVLAPVVDPAKADAYELSPVADFYASRMKPQLQRMVEALVPQIAQAAREDHVHKSEIPKLIAADRAAQKARAKDGETELTRVDGTPTGGRDRSHEATISRIADGTHDDIDTAYWRKWELTRSK